MYFKVTELLGEGREWMELVRFEMINCAVKQNPIWSF